MDVVTRTQSGSIIAPPRTPDYGGGSGGSGSAFPISKAHLATWILLTGITMLFAGLSSAYIVLRGLPEWRNITVPPLVWLNTLFLMASSAAIEFARSALRSGRPAGMKLWLCFSGILGFVFLAGQIKVWRHLVGVGVYLSTTLHSSFFYVLTGAHALHLAGGLVGLAIVLRHAFANRLTAANHESLKVWALYWHFMDVVWIYCFLLLLLA